MLNRLVFLFFLSTFSVTSKSQSSLYHNQPELPKSTILIATSNQYKQLEFSIDNHKEIVKQLKKLVYGKEKEYVYEKSPVVIKVVTNGKISKTWIVFPASSLIEVDGKKYSFNTTLLSELNKKFPIDYFIEERIFKSQKQQEEYFQKLLKDKNFLYIVPHDFENEWIEKFNLTFKTNINFSSPAAITKYLDTTFFKTTNREKYSITYSPFSDAKNDSKDEITMSIYSVKEIYQYFTDTIATKSGRVFYPAYIVRKK